MSKGNWYGEPVKITSVSLPLSLLRAAKKAHLNLSGLLRVSILKTLRKEDDLRQEFTKMFAEIQNLKQSNANLRSRIYEMGSALDQNNIKFDRYK